MPHGLWGTGTDTGRATSRYRITWSVKTLHRDDPRTLEREVILDIEKSGSKIGEKLRILYGDGYVYVKCPAGAQTCRHPPSPDGEYIMKKSFS